MNAIDYPNKLNKRQKIKKKEFKKKTNKNEL